MATPLHSPQLVNMAKNLKQVLAQIDSLQKQAEQLRKKEVAGVIERIQEAIAHYGLTAEDLFGTRRPRTSPAKKAQVAKPAKPRPRRWKGKAPVSVPKYQLGRDSWTGQGRRPKWFVDALAAGKSPDDMLVQKYLDAIELK